MKKGEILALIDKLNDDYVKVHKNYENLFWRFYMGDRTLEAKFNRVSKELDAFRSDRKLTEEVEKAIKQAKGDLRERLLWWRKFFAIYRTPDELVALKNSIIDLESKIQTKRNSRKEGYIDPQTGKFIETSANKMRTMMATSTDEKIRKSCFEAIETLAVGLLDEYVEIVKLRNQFAKQLGYEDFYDYKLKIVEGMTKKEVFGIFEEIYKKTKYIFGVIRKMEKKIPKLRDPWNFSYLTTGDFIKEEDEYFQFDKALNYWGESFAAMGVDYNGGELHLDLLDRNGKHNNGFFHCPKLSRWKNGKLISGSSNFTCNVVLNQVGAGVKGLRTLFHEGGHAADKLNSRQKDTILNTEYPPASVAWSETNSQFFDTIMNSVEWQIRYAKNDAGKSYPFELFERKVRKLQPLAALGMMSVMFMSEFEKEIYETKDLTKEKALKIAIKMDKKYHDMTRSSYLALYIPHIYSWESSAYYHGYGLSKLAVFQWREYFYKKYGYIVDNPQIGKEMSKIWKLGSSKNFLESVKLATGKNLSINAYIKEVTRNIDDVLSLARRRTKRLESIKANNNPVKLNATIKMVDGSKIICTNSKSFEDMVNRYNKWLSGKIET